VAVKVSALCAVSDPQEAYPHLAASPFVELLLESFGVERCLWKSDFSPRLYWVSFQQATNLVQLRGLGPGEQELVMGKNLLRLIGEHQPG
jgi:L-fuconolactonase